MLPTDSPLAARAVTVRYGATTALDAVDLELRHGEIHALVGENGAGKSTLLRVLAGVLRPQTGSVESAAGLRVGWVPQEAELPADLCVADWIFLGAELRGPLGWLRQAAMRDAAAALLARVGCDASPDAALGALAATQRKQVQLARALRERAGVLLLDEPTAVLGAAEAARLFAIAREMAATGAAVVYVSHRLQEVVALADRVTVLRDGRRVATAAIGDVDSDWLVARMVGRDLQDTAGRARQYGPPLLRVRGLAVGRVREVSFDLRAGEIVGLAGLVGAGRSACLEALAGLRRRARGTVAMEARAVLVAEDRARTGLVPTLSLRENLYLPADVWRLDHAGERRGARAWIEALAIRCAGTEVGIDTLSGGNQQKLLLARALRHRPRVLLLDEPTAGVDVGAKREIHAAIERLATDGAAVLLASSDLPELLGLCDRIIALYRGGVAGELPAAAASEPRLAAMITGMASGEASAPSPLAP